MTNHLKKIFLILIQFAFVYSIVAQCPTDDVIIKNKIDIENYLSNFGNCDSIFYNVEVSFVDNVDFLKNVNYIDKELHLYSVNDSLIGLKNLTYVGADLTILSNNQINFLNNFETLSTIDGTLILNDLENLVNLKFPNEQFKMDGLLFSNNNNLDKLDLYYNTISSMQEIRIENSNLREIYGMDSLNEIVFFSLSKLDSLINIKGFESLNSIQYLFILDNKKLNNLDFLSHAESIVEISIRNNDNLNDCSGLCNYLLSQESFSGLTIENNKTGCNSIEEILESCIITNNENSKLTQTLIFPNPIISSSQIYSNQVIEEIKVYDILGRKIIKKTIFDNNVNLQFLEFLPKSQYFIYLTYQDNSRSTIHKITID